MAEFPFIPGKTTKAAALRIVAVRQEALDQAEAHDDPDMPMLLICVDREPLGKLAMNQAVSLRNYLDEFVSEQLKAMHRSLTNRAAHAQPKRRPPGAPCEPTIPSPCEGEGEGGVMDEASTSTPRTDFADLPTTSLGQFLRARRKQREKTLRTVERICNLPINTMSAFESGRMIPSADRLARLADHFDLPLETLKRLAERDLAIKNATATRIHRRAV